MVTPKLMVGFGCNSTMSEILCMSSLFAYLMKIHPKMKALWCPQHFPHYFLLSVTSYSEESKILCLSWLPKSVTKIQSKMKALYRVNNILSGTQGQVSQKCMV